MLLHAPKEEFLQEGEPPKLNLLQLYSYRAAKHFGPDKPYVLLLYLSPRKGEDLIPTLQHEMIAHFLRYTSFNFFVGVAPQQSNFFGILKDY